MALDPETIRDDLPWSSRRWSSRANLQWGTDFIEKVFPFARLEEYPPTFRKITLVELLPQFMPGCLAQFRLESAISRL